MSKKQAERIAVFVLAAFLVGYFCYQVAYGIEMTIGPNAMTFGDMPLGSTVSNVTGNATGGSATIHVGPPPVHPSNTTWTAKNIEGFDCYDDWYNEFRIIGI
jgi:hypothetical protein